MKGMCHYRTRGACPCMKAQLEQTSKACVQSGWSAIACTHYQLTLWVEKFDIKPSRKIAMSIPRHNLSCPSYQRAFHQGIEFKSG